MSTKKTKWCVWTVRNLRNADLTAYHSTHGIPVTKRHVETSPKVLEWADGDPVEASPRINEILNKETMETQEAIIPASVFTAKPLGSIMRRSEYESCARDIMRARAKLKRWDITRQELKDNGGLEYSTLFDDVMPYIENARGAMAFCDKWKLAGEVYLARTTSPAGNAAPEYYPLDFQPTPKELIQCGIDPDAKDAGLSGDSPDGVYCAAQTTGEKRMPQEGEWYVVAAGSGIVVRASGDGDWLALIAKPVKVRKTTVTQFTRVD